MHAELEQSLAGLSLLANADRVLAKTINIRVLGDRMAGIQINPRIGEPLHTHTQLELLQLLTLTLDFDKVLGLPSHCLRNDDLYQYGFQLLDIKDCCKMWLY